ncbi:MAG: hypothetical protein CTY14_01970 [Methylotenera sp.]|nr:MAG: hypothetical protein CTY14_01970 [Methylotenera sp.]
MINKLRTIISNILFTVTGFLSIINKISIIAFHIFTVIFIYKINGLLLSVLLFFMPFIAQIYALFKSYKISGTFINEYSYQAIILVSYLFFAFFITILAVAVSPKK